MRQKNKLHETFQLSVLIPEFQWVRLSIILFFTLQILFCDVLKLKKARTNTMDVKTLGIDQIKWLNMYGSINLNHWRFILINNQPDWLYVGAWKPGHLDDGYSERQRNLESDRYYYWTS